MAKILLFFKHWSIYLFQSNQRFQAIEFVDRPVPIKLYIFRINLPCLAFDMPRYLSPVSTVSDYASDYADDLEPTEE